MIHAGKLLHQVFHVFTMAYTAVDAVEPAGKASFADEAYGSIQCNF